MPSAGAWAVSAKADDFFELSGDQLPLEDIAFVCQSQLNCVRRSGVVNKTKGASSCPGRGRPYCRESSEPHQGDIQGVPPWITFASFS